jgi:hypothetical protein
MRAFLLARATVAFCHPVVDEKHQIIVNAEAYGEGQEAHLLQPMLESTREGLKSAKISPDVFEQTKVTADAGYHSGASVRYTQENSIDAYIADRNHRQRDPAFSDYDRYKTRSRKEKRQFYGRDTDRFTAKDFVYDEKDRSCRCPAGNRLYRNGSNININGFIGMKFRGAKSVCGPCLLRERCLKTPETTETKQVTIFIGRSEENKESPDREDAAQVRHPIRPVHLQQTDRYSRAGVWEFKEQRDGPVYPAQQEQSEHPMATVQLGA